MEIGALLCKPKNPKCDICPLNNLCVSKLYDQVSKIPINLKKSKKYYKFKASGLIILNQKILIHRRHDTKLLNGLWEFPSVESKDNKNLKVLLKKYLLKNVCSEAKIGLKVEEYIHRYTSFITKILFFKIDKIKSINESENIKLVNFSDLKKYAMPAPYRKYINSNINI